MKFGEKKDINNFDWLQSRIIFISTNFTKYQINSINFKDLPIELWKIKRYNNNTISFEQILSVIKEFSSLQFTKKPIESTEFEKIEKDIFEVMEEIIKYLFEFCLEEKYLK